MVIKSIQIINFKSIAELTVELDENLSVITGAISSGKSSFLQAIALLRSIVSGEVESFLLHSHREWSSNELTNKMNNKKPLNIKLFYKSMMSNMKHILNLTLHQCTVHMKTSRNYLRMGINV